MFHDLERRIGKRGDQNCWSTRVWTTASHLLIHFRVRRWVMRISLCRKGRLPEFQTSKGPFWGWGKCRFTVLFLNDWRLVTQRADAFILIFSRLCLRFLFENRTQFRNLECSEVFSWSFCQFYAWTTSMTPSRPKLRTVIWSVFTSFEINKN